MYLNTTIIDVVRKLLHIFGKKPATEAKKATK